jgi:hypothetical protein
VAVVSKNRPHPTELKEGDIVCPPWNPRFELKVSRVEETTLGETLERLSPDVSPDTRAWSVYGIESWPEVEEGYDPPEKKLVFSDVVGNPAYYRPILLKSAGQEAGVEL